MSTVISKVEASRDGIPAKDKWLRAYRQMVRIRLFEEQVNELYTRALMPGLAHLYSGQEAVAVGICEALRIDDYITSTHRGHGHCLAKGASSDRMYGVDQFSAIITPPQAAILAVGGIADKAVAIEGKPEVRPMMSLTLSCDHRVADGARAAMFLRDFVQALRDPAKFLG